MDEQSCYNRDLLREQISTLRKEASLREKTEKVIEKKFGEETTRLKDETASKIQTIEERCTTQIVSLNADFEKDKKRLEGQVETQQATLDKQKKERESQILREWEEAEKEKTDDLEFETLSAGESLKQQKEDAERKTSLLIESLDQTIDQLDNDLKKLKEKFTKWRVPSASSVVAADSEADPDDQAAANSSDAALDSPSLPEGKELIEYLKTLIKEIQEDTKAMLALPSVRWGFSDAVTASIVHEASTSRVMVLSVRDFTRNCMPPHRRSTEFSVHAFWM